jgi:sucrose-6-phosphate hydrolase SacC (GH32 family)
MSDPNQVQWQKSAHNPIIDFTTLPSPYNSYNFRDPAIWPKSGKDGGYCVAMAAEVNAAAHVVLYDCAFTYDAPHSDFQTFCTYYSTLWSTSAIPMVECPDFYPLPASSSSQHVLKYSKMEDRREYYELGTYDESKGVFTVTKDGFEYDYGFNNHFYASKTFSVSSNAQGNGNTRRILWGWLPESDINSEKTWSGAMALPRDVTYSDLWKALLFQPIKELSSLRDPQTHYNVHLNNLIINGHDDPSVTAGEYMIPLPITSMVTEVHAIFHIDLSVVDTPSDCAIEVGFLSRTSTFPAEVKYETITKELPTRYTKHTVGITHSYTDIGMFTAIDVMKAGGNTAPNTIQKTIPGDLKAWLEAAGNHNNHNKDSYGIDIDMTFFADHSVMEMYVLGGVSVSTTRVYPDQNDVGFAAYVKTCDNAVQRVVLHSVEAWELNSI